MYFVMADILSWKNSYFPESNPDKEMKHNIIKQFLEFVITYF